MHVLLFLAVIGAIVYNCYPMVTQANKQLDIDITNYCQQLPPSNDPYRNITIAICIKEIRARIGK